MSGIYERNYFDLTETEISESKRLKNKFTTKIGKFKIQNSSLNLELPKAVRHNNSLFPNNYLDFLDLYENETMSELNRNYFKAIKNDQATELSIKKEILDNSLYHIIGSILKGGQYHFGHHNLYIFPEFQLGSSYRVDYLLVGLASGGHQFVFIEMEHPYKNIVLKDGNYGEAIRKGINQLNDWKNWLDSNYSSLSETFKNATNKSLPEEFYKYDASRMHFCVVAGRRKIFEEKTYWLKRNEMKQSGIKLFHYDNLYDFATNLITKKEHGYISY